MGVNVTIFCHSSTLNLSHTLSTRHNRVVVVGFFFFSVFCFLFATTNLIVHYESLTSWKYLSNVTYQCCLYKNIVPGLPIRKIVMYLIIWPLTELSRKIELIMNQTKRNPKFFVLKCHSETESKFWQL